MDNKLTAAEDEEIVLETEIEYPAFPSFSYLGVAFMYLLLVFISSLLKSDSLTMGLNTTFLGLIYVSIAIQSQQMTRVFSSLVERVDELEMYLRDVDKKQRSTN